MGDRHQKDVRELKVASGNRKPAMSEEQAAMPEFSLTCKVAVLTATTRLLEAEAGSRARKGIRQFAFTDD